MAKYAKQQDQQENVKKAYKLNLQEDHKLMQHKSVGDITASGHENGTALLREELDRAASLLHKAEQEHEQDGLNDAVEAALLATEHVARPPGGPPDYRENHNTLDDEPGDLAGFDPEWWMATPVGMSMALWNGAWQRYWEFLNEEIEKFSAMTPTTELFRNSVSLPVKMMEGMTQAMTSSFSSSMGKMFSK